MDFVQASPAGLSAWRAMAVQRARLLQASEPLGPWKGSGVTRARFGQVPKVFLGPIQLCPE